MIRCSLGLGALRPDQLSAAFKFGKEYFLRTSKVDEKWSGDGIVICGGGKYLQWTLNNLRNIRRFDANVPIQVWCLNAREIPDLGVFGALGAEVVNVQDVLPQFPMRKMGPWHLKMLSVLLSPFQNCLLLDADCFATKAGLKLFNHVKFQEKGALFCQDVRRCHGSDLPYFCASIQPPRFLKDQQEFETGAFLVDKNRHHPAIRMAVWLSEHSDAWWTPLLHGDKGSTEIAWRGLKLPFTLLESQWLDWGIRHELDGAWCFAHCLGTKRGKAAMPDLTLP